MPYGDLVMWYVLSEEPGREEHVVSGGQGVGCVLYGGVLDGGSGCTLGCKGSSASGMHRTLCMEIWWLL